MHEDEIKIIVFKQCRGLEKRYGKDKAVGDPFVTRCMFFTPSTVVTDSTVRCSIKLDSVPTCERWIDADVNCCGVSIVKQVT